jgi:hypothetical protein
MEDIKEAVKQAVATWETDQREKSQDPLVASPDISR